jgi:hypothetical protein
MEVGLTLSICPQGDLGSGGRGGAWATEAAYRAKRPESGTVEDKGSEVRN